MTTLVKEEIDKAKSELENELQESNNAAKLSESLAEKNTLTELTQYIASSLAELIDAQCVALYLANNNNKDKGTGKLLLSSTFACDKQDNIPQEIIFGDGIIGQCAIEKKPIVLDKVPKDYIHITSALGSKIPSSIMIFPILYKNQILAVMEFATFESITERKTMFLKKISNTIGLSINNSLNLDKLSLTLGKSQELNNELNAQQEELRSANEKTNRSKERTARI